MADIPYGYCHCGCGEKTGIARFTDRHKGWSKGEPKRYLPNHVNRFNGPEYEIAASGCWLWCKSMRSDGYGQVLSGRAKIPAHRHIYERLIGPIPDELQLDHLCRNPRCVNPAHLEPVTQRENIRRSATTKLTENDVREIRAQVAAGWTQATIANRFGVSPKTVSSIHMRRTWADVR